MAYHGDPSAQRLGKWLDNELKTRGWGKRTLARKLAGKDATLVQIDNERRQILDYVKGEVNPSPEKRKRIARALGVKVSDLPDDDEDDLQVDLRRTLQKIADRVPVKA